MEVGDYYEAIVVAVTVRKQELELTWLQSRDVFGHDNLINLFDWEKSITLRILFVENVSKSALETDKKLPRNGLQHLSLHSVRLGLALSPCSFVASGATTSPDALLRGDHIYDHPC